MLILYLMNIKIFKQQYLVSLNNQIVNLKKYLIIRIVVLAQILSKKMIIFKKYLKFYKINNKIKMIFNKKLLKKI